MCCVVGKETKQKEASYLHDEKGQGSPMKAAAMQCSPCAH